MNELNSAITDALQTATPEVIVCAANLVRLSDGSSVIVPGVRHFDDIMRPLLNSLTSGHPLVHVTQGFLNNRREFLTRERALAVATAAGQINRYRPKTQPESQLFSEDLY